MWEFRFSHFSTLCMKEFFRNWKLKSKIKHSNVQCVKWCSVALRQSGRENSFIRQSWARYRRIHLQVFYSIAVLKEFKEFKWFHCTCFLLSFAKFLRTGFQQNMRQLPLNIEILQSKMQGNLYLPKVFEM